VDEGACTVDAGATADGAVVVVFVVETGTVEEGGAAATGAPAATGLAILVVCSMTETKDYIHKKNFNPSLLMEPHMVSNNFLDIIQTYHLIRTSTNPHFFPILSKYHAT
jgi:hypothetical protein